MPRPRTIPEEEALERALREFWTKGYERTSIADLGAAIGVGPSSLYNAFGSKAELFRRALGRYLATHAVFTASAESVARDRGARAALEEFLRAAVTLYTTRGLPPGCAILRSGDCEDSEGGAITRELRGELEALLRSLLSHARPGELTDKPRLLAKLVLGSMRGLSQLACDGTSRRDLLAIVRHVVASCFAEQPGAE